MARYRFTRTRWLASSALAITVFGTAAQAQQAPTGGQVKAGSASITQTPGATNIRQNSQRAVIDWTSFNIGAGGRVDIDQPNAGAALLNRVTAKDASTIAGAMNANGQVFLVNQNGVVITKDGKIATQGGFVASTMNITDEDFMANHLRFAGSGAGTVINRGTIAGGAVALLGAGVSNEGYIVSSVGKVALGAGSQATLDLNGDGMLQVALPGGLVDAGGRPLVSNGGRIESLGGVVLLKAAVARDAVRQAVNMSGMIRATHIGGDGGTVVLDGGEGGAVTITGAIDASGANGGRIDATGSSVALQGGTLTATGTTRGGLVRLGGMFQGGAVASQATAGVQSMFRDRFGAEVSLRAADTTSTDAASLIDVGGGVSGGTAILWSNKATDQAGIIRAGNGAVELSSHGRLSTALDAVTVGRGTLLLDPKNVEVGDSVTAPSWLASDTTYFGVGSVIDQMNAGTDVVLRASNDLNWNASNAQVDFRFSSSGHSGGLTLSAGRNVALGGYMTLYSSDLTVIANDSVANGVVDADRDPGLASIDALGAVISTQVGGGQTAGNIRFVLGKGEGLTNGGISRSGNRMPGLAGGNITLDDSGQGGLWSFFPGQGQGKALDPIALTSTGTVTISGGIVANSSGGLTVSGRSVNWVSENTSPLRGYINAPIAFVESGTTTRYGVIADNPDSSSDMTRVALGNGAAYGDMTYGAATPTLTPFRITGGVLRSGDTLAMLAAALNVTTSGAPGTTSAVGTYDILARAALAQGSVPVGYFFNLTDAHDALRVVPKALTATITNGSYTYGTPSALVALSGVINGDVVSPLASLDGGTATAMLANGTGFGFAALLGQGQHGFALAGLTGAGAGNYSLDLTGLSGTITIARKLLTYRIADTSAVYGTPGSSTGVLDGVLGSDAVSLAAIASTGFSSTARVGTYAITGSGLTGAGADNYAIATTGNTNGTLTVTPKPVSFAASNGTSVYGDTPTVAAATLTGIINGDAVGATTLVDGGTVGLTRDSNAGTYRITSGLTGTDAGNYLLTGGTAGTYTISQRPLNVTLSDVIGVYGSTSAILTLSGLTGRDGAAPVMKIDGSWIQPSDLGGGQYGLSARAGVHQLSDFGISSNYLPVFTAGSSATFTVQPKELTYWVGTTQQVYRGGNALPAVTLNGILPGDVYGANGKAGVAGTLSINGATVTNPLDVFALNVGSYAATVTGLIGDFASNYRLASSGNTIGSYVVTPAILKFSVGDAATTYGTLATLPDPVLINFSTGENPLNVQGVVGATQGGTGIILGTRTAAGTYQLSVTSLKGSGAGNYQLDGGRVGTLTISPKTLTYSATGPGSLVYGQAISPPSLILNGIVSGDDVTGLAGFANASGNLLTKATTGLIPARLDVGTYVLGVRGLSGADIGNYVLSATGNTNALLSISPKHISFQIAPLSWTYGDIGGIPVTLTGVEAGDDVQSLAPYVMTTNNPSRLGGVHVGTYGMTVDGIAGLAANNYVLDGVGVSAGTLTVTPRPITASVGFLNGQNSATYGSINVADLRPVAIFGNAANNDGDSGIASRIFATIATPDLPLSSAGRLKAGSYSFAITGLTGSGVSDYQLVGTQAAVFTVNLMTIGYAGTLGDSVTYGSAKPINTPTTYGALSGDDVTALPYVVTSNATGAAITLNAQTPVGLYTLSGGGIVGADAGNYSITARSASYTIIPKYISYTIGDTSWTYGDAPKGMAVTFDGLVGNDVVTGVRALTFTDRSNAGSYREDLIGLSGPAAANYLIMPSRQLQTATATILPRPLTFVPSANTAQTVTYLDRTQSYGSLSGILSGDSVTIAQTYRTGPSGLPTVFDTGSVVPSGTYIVGLERSGTTHYQLGGASGGNYMLSVLPNDQVGTLTVDRRALTPTVWAQPNTVYGDTVPYTITLTGAPQSYINPASIFGLIDGQRLADPQTGFIAGTHIVSAGIDDPNFYISGGNTASVSVAQRMVNYGLTAASRGTYGDILPISVTLLSDLPDRLKAEAMAKVLVDGRLLDTNQLGLNAGDHILSLAAGSSNFLLSTNPTANVTIDKRMLTYLLSAPASGVYGDTVPYTIALQSTLPSWIQAEGTPYVMVDGKALSDPQLGFTAGQHVISLGLNSANFTMASQPVGIAIAKRPLIVTPLDTTAVFGSTPANNMVRLDNVVRGDSFSIGIDVGPNYLGTDTVTELSQTSSNTYASDATLSWNRFNWAVLDGGKRSFSIKSITGAALSNYDVTLGAPATLMITPKPITYSIGSNTLQYGMPLAFDAAPFLQIKGSVPGRGGGGGAAWVMVNGVAQPVTDALPPGTYTLVPRPLGTSDALNYVYAATGNTTGTLTITPAKLRVSISSGGRMYSSGNGNNYIDIGSPGILSFWREDGNPFVVGNDKIGLSVQLYKDGAPWNSKYLPVGSYEYRPVGPTGPDASRYVLGSVSYGSLLVQDSSVFNFGFLTNTLNTVYTPPASVMTVSASATATASGTVGPTGVTGTAGASAGVTAGIGIVSVNTTASASVSGSAKLGADGLTLLGSAGVDVSSTLNIGPAFIAYGAYASADGKAVIDRSGVTAEGKVEAGAYNTTGAGGGLGNGVDGSAQVDSAVFIRAEAKGTGKYEDGTVKIETETMVGAGASVGTSGTISGGGVSGSASATLYSPGMLGAGFETNSGYSNGTVTVGFSLKLAIGIGGLEIAPSFSFDAAGAANTISNAANDLGSALLGVGCNSNCRSNNARNARIGVTNHALDLFSKPGQPTYELMTYLAANPGALTLSQSEWPVGKAQQINEMIAMNATYGSIPSQLTDTVQQEQALLRRMQTISPKDITLADMQQAQALRDREAYLITTINKMGGKIQVADGKISMVAQ